MRKLIFEAGGLVAAFAVAIALLMGTSADVASANIVTVTSSATTIAAAGTATLTIDAQNETGLVNGTNEVQTIAAGDRTGGTLVLNFDGQATAAIACNAALGVVDAALEALPNIGLAGVTSTGGALGTAAVVVTFVVGGNVSLMTVTADTCTGGATSPSVAETTPGTADTDKPIQVLATAGTVGSILCTGGTLGCLGVSGPGSNNVSVPNLLNDLDIVTAVFTAPATGPTVASLTVIQDGLVKVLTITVRGTASAVTLTATSAAIAATGAPAGVAVATIREINNTTFGQAAANLNAKVVDSAGNVLPSVTVIYITTDGTLRIVGAGAAANSDVTNTSGYAELELVADATTDDGESVTVTASAVGKSSTVDIAFGGAPATCTITADQTSPQAGATVLLTVEFLDASGGPVPDRYLLLIAGTPDVQAVNSVGGGTFALFAPGRTSAGTATASLAVGAQGGTAIVVSNSSANCSTSIVVAGAVVTPPLTNGGGTGDGAIVGTLPSSGFGLVTFGGSVDELKTALATSCASGAPIFATSGGAFVGYFPTTSIVAVNAAFNALYTGGIAASTPLLGGNC